MWSTEPVTYIGTYPAPSLGQGKLFLSTDAPDVWNYEDGQTIRVVCYTNAPQARLLLDGEQVGEMKPYDDKTGIIYWDIPFRAGTLKAEGCDERGDVLSEYGITTSGRPYAIRASADKTVLSKDKATAHITVTVVDENGVRVKLADNNITCTVDGPVELLGLEGSDDTDMGDYTDNKQRVYNGRLLAYIRTTGEAGEILVSFTSPLLKGVSVKLTAE